ncbi:MAG TPA: hypothetical protein VNV66_03270 [Pilimelia sp.]|nr:hypothetical protein [Pilimelia sp.]
MPGEAPISGAEVTFPGWERLRSDPGHLPELLALAAVRRIGPVADRWCRHLQATYPGATPDGLARLAVRHFCRSAAVGGVAAALTGLLRPAAELSALAWHQAGVVLHVAAAYGADPRHPDRAVDLLVLTRIQPNAEVARAAVAQAVSDDSTAGRPAWQQAAEGAWRLAAPAANETPGWLALRLIGRAVPGLSSALAGAGSSASTERLAHRAIGHYRRAPTG